MSVRQRSKHFDELTGSAAAVDVDAEHFTKHGNANLKADANKEAEQNRLRQEICKEAKLQQASEQKKDPGQQRHQARECDVSRTGHRGQTGEATRKYGRSGGISSYDKIARRTKDGKRNQGKQKRVEAGNDRHAGDFGVAKRLRNVHGRERKSREEVLRYLRPPKRPQPLEDGKAICDATASLESELFSADYGRYPSLFHCLKRSSC